MTVFTIQWACQNSVSKDRSDEVSGKADCATSAGFMGTSLSALPLHWSNRRGCRKTLEVFAARARRLVARALDRKARSFAKTRVSTTGGITKSPRNLAKLGRAGEHPAGQKALIVVKNWLAAVCRRMSSTSPRAAGGRSARLDAPEAAFSTNQSPHPGPLATRWTDPPPPRGVGNARACATKQKAALGEGRPSRHGSVATVNLAAGARPRSGGCDARP